MKPMKVYFALLVQKLQYLFLIVLEKKNLTLQPKSVKKVFVLIVIVLQSNTSTLLVLITYKQHLLVPSGWLGIVIKEDTPFVNLLKNSRKFTKFEWIQVDIY
jgi:hypothetical protein